MGSKVFEEKDPEKQVVEKQIVKEVGKNEKAEKNEKLEKIEKHEKNEKAEKESKDQKDTPDTKHKQEKEKHEKEHKIEGKEGLLEKTHVDTLPTAAAQPAGIGTTKLTDKLPQLETKLHKEVKLEIKEIKHEKIEIKEHKIEYKEYKNEKIEFEGVVGSLNRAAPLSSDLPPWKQRWRNCCTSSPRTCGPTLVRGRSSRNPTQQSRLNPRRNRTKKARANLGQGQVQHLPFPLSKHTCG